MDQKDKAQLQNQESHYTLDSQEEMESEYDLSLNQNQSINLSKTSSVVRCSGDVNTSVSSINTSILDDTEEVKVLKDKLSELEMKCKYLGSENDKLSTELNTHKTRNQKLEKKLQFVKDNQEVFMRLKEAYINMKYNEAAGRKMIEIREKGIQTWQGILCRGCIQAEELRRHVESLREMYNDSYIIASFEMDQLVNTIKYLRDLIDRREKNWSSYKERESAVQTRMRGLERENNILRNVLKNRNINVDEIPIEESEKTTDNTSNKDITQLRKIIIKFERRFKEIEANSTEPLKLSAPALNEKEKRIVNLIMSKYNSRLQRKSNEKLRSQSTRDTRQDSINSKLIHDLKFGSSCPKFKSTKSDISSTAAFKNPMTSEGSAIMMMDDLFSSEN